MKFNHLKKALRQYEKNTTPAPFAPPPQVRRKVEKQATDGIRDGPGEKVVGGDILWKPIDRTAAMVVSKAPWWAKPPPELKPLPPTTKLKKKRNRMKGAVIDSGSSIQQNTGIAGDYRSQVGLHVTMVNGEPMVPVDEVNDLICREINDRLEKLVNPNIKAAQDARKIIDELLHGIGGDMEKFRANTKIYLEEIRQTRFAVVTETAQITKSLAEVRQFFLGSDYKEERSRLTEFVDLCERLHKLKEAGFLDTIADTMLKLGETNSRPTR